jgi:hypothetical protein
MDASATDDTFFTASGPSPPSDTGHALKSNDDAPVERQVLPPQLIEDLAALLASALVADIRQYPNLAEIQAHHDPTVESPRELNRTQRAPARTRRHPSRSRRRPRVPTPTSGPGEG